MKTVDPALRSDLEIGTCCQCAAKPSYLSLVPSLISHARFSQHHIDSTTSLPFFIAKKRQYNSLLDSLQNPACSAQHFWSSSCGITPIRPYDILDKGGGHWNEWEECNEDSWRSSGCQWGLFRAASATCSLCPRRHPHFYISFLSDYLYSQLITPLKRLVGSWHGKHGTRGGFSAAVRRSGQIIQSARPTSS